MEPLDHDLVLPGRFCCSVCDEPVPRDRVRLLARRDDLAFLQIECDACLSTTLGFSLDGHVEGGSADPERGPVTGDDVLDMHQLLAAWQGDVVGLMTADAARFGSPANPAPRERRARSSR